MRVLVAVVLLALPLAVPAHALDDHLARTDIASPPANAKNEHLASFVQLSDIHLIDDDAPVLRVEYLDPLANSPSPIPFGAAWRPQDEYTDEMFATQVRAIDQQAGLDFVIATGDSIDNALESEAVRVLDIAHGTTTAVGPVTGQAFVPDGVGGDPWNVLVPAGESMGASSAFDPTRIPSWLHPAGIPDALREPGANPGLSVPFYETLGNHDHFAQGNAPGLPFNTVAAAHGRQFLDEANLTRTLFGGAPFCDGSTYIGAPGAGAGLGFAGDRLCDSDPQNNGYYSFAEGPLRFIVLDTANDEILGETSNGVHPDPLARVDGGTGIGGRDNGALDVLQFQWLKGELDAANAAGETVVLFAHHDMKQWFFPDQASALGFVTGADVAKLVGSYPNIAAFFAGHSHDERAMVDAQGAAPFWDVQTGSLIDLPQEGRRVDVDYRGDGVVELRLTMIASDCALDAGHAALQAACLRSHALAATDTQRDGGHPGTPGDRDVILFASVSGAAKTRLDAL